MQYFRMQDDVNISGRWFIEGPRPVDSSKEIVTEWGLMEGRKLDILPTLETRIFQPGNSLEITFAVFDMPIVSRRANALFLEHYSDYVQSIPITIHGRTEGFYVLNITHALKCMDEQRSMFTKWTKEDHRPDKAGQYRAIYNMVLKSSIIENTHIFRIVDDYVTIVVSDTVRKMVEQHRLTGVKFEEIELS